MDIEIRGTPNRPIVGGKSATHIVIPDARALAELTPGAQKLLGAPGLASPPIELAIAPVVMQIVQARKAHKEKENPGKKLGLAKAGLKWLELLLVRYFGEQTAAARRRCLGSWYQEGLWPLCGDVGVELLYIPTDFKRSKPDSATPTQVPHHDRPAIVASQLYTVLKRARQLTTGRIALAISDVTIVPALVEAFDEGIGAVIDREDRFTAKTPASFNLEEDIRVFVGVDAQQPASIRKWITGGTLEPISNNAVHLSVCEPMVTQSVSGQPSLDFVAAGPLPPLNPVAARRPLVVVLDNGPFSASYREIYEAVLRIPESELVLLAQVAEEGFGLSRRPEDKGPVALEAFDVRRQWGLEAIEGRHPQVRCRQEEGVDRRHLGSSSHVEAISGDELIAYELRQELRAAADATDFVFVSYDLSLSTFVRTFATERGIRLIVPCAAKQPMSMHWSTIHGPSADEFYLLLRILAAQAAVTP